MASGNPRHSVDPCAEPVLQLSAADRAHLDKLDRRLQVVRDRTRGVILGLQTGFYLWGRGGIGKSHVVVEELKVGQADYRLHNSHVTPRGLVDLLHASPDSIHLFEDVETMLSQKDALGVLRSAMWGSQRGRDGRVERIVIWRAHRTTIRFAFRGGIIITANRAISELPELEALKTRISYLQLVASNPEITALMRHVAIQGDPNDEHGLSREERMEVAEFVVAQSRGPARDLDMRILMNAFADRLQAEDGEAGCTWQDLVLSRIDEQASHVGPVVPRGIRARRKAQEWAITREVLGLPRHERKEIWKQRTGKSEATLYRRMGELANSDAQELGIPSAQS